MGYFQPMVIYRNPNEERKNSVIRYIGNRVLRSNKNFLCAIVGSTGNGKSYAGLRMCEDYAKMFNINFDPNIHVISSLKGLLKLITSDDLDKKIQFGSVLLFDEPQVEANSRNWQSDINQAFGQLISTFRNQRLVIFFAFPYLEMIDKQSRILFHGEFKVEGFDKNTKISNVKPRFLEYNKNRGDFYRKRLIIQFKEKGKEVMNVTKLHNWHLPLASKHIIDTYEAKKKKFTDDLNKKLLANIELQEKKDSGKDKSDEFFKVTQLYNKFGENYVKILEEMPHLTPFVVEKYIQFIKRSKKFVKERE